MADLDGRSFHRPTADNGGCRVQVLPAVTPSADPQLPARPAQVTVLSARILILDDDHAIAELLGEMLTLLGYSTVLCHSAQVALEWLDRQEFNLIISDFRMPKMDGQEFYEQAVRKKPELARRILFLSGDVVNEETQGFLRATGNPHLTKPFRLALVEQIVAQVLQQSAVAR